MWTVFHPSDDHDLDRYYAIVSRSFNFPEEDLRTYRAFTTPEDTLLVRNDHGIVGGLYVHQLGQYFGGRDVPMAGVAIVAIEPTARGRGAATTLMNEAVLEMHRRGAPMSTLFPASQALYRRSGYERAGIVCEATVPVKLIGVRDREVRIRAASDEDHDAMRELHDMHAARYDGFIRRNAFLWSRARTSRLGESDGYVFEDDRGMIGYAYIARTTSSTGDMHLRVLDVVTTNAASGRAAWELLARHASVVEEAHLSRAPSDPLYALLPEQTPRFRIRDHWMVRIVDVARALEARGYPPGINGTVAFDVRDDLIPSNNTRFTLDVENGRGAVTAGGNDAIPIDIRGLAALYAGHQPLPALDMLGLTTSTPDAAAATSRLFPAGRPSMAEAF